MNAHYLTDQLVFNRVQRRPVFSHLTPKPSSAALLRRIALNDGWANGASFTAQGSGKPAYRYGANRSNYLLSFIHRSQHGLSHRRRPHVKDIERRVRKIPPLVIIGFVLAISILAGLLSDGDVAVIAIVPGIAGLIYALFQFGDAGATLDGLNRANDGLDGLANRLDTSVEHITGAVRELDDQLSTQRLDVFPNFMPAIVDLLRKAKHEVVICCDHPAYGVFSNRRAYENYANTIRSKIEQGIPVSLLCNNPLRRAQLHAGQIAIQDGWEAWQSDPKMSAFIAEYGSPEQHAAYATDPESIAEADFLKLLDKADERALREAFCTAAPDDTITTDQVLPLYFWMVDGQTQHAKAVFALAPLASGALEVGFRTEDPGLIGALNGIYKRYEQVTPAGSGIAPGQ